MNEYSQALIEKTKAYYRARCGEEISDAEATLRLRSLGKVFLTIAHIRESVPPSLSGGSERAKRAAPEPSDLSSFPEQIRT